MGAVGIASFARQWVSLIEAGIGKFADCFWRSRHAASVLDLLVRRRRLPSGSARACPTGPVPSARNAMSPDQPPMSLMAVSRHQWAHILKPTQHWRAILAKDAAARQERR